MLYTASVRNKETREYTAIQSEYPSKKAFAEDLRRNGYAVRFIVAENQDFYKECQKYYSKIERDSAKRLNKRIEEIKAEIRASQLMNNTGKE